MKKLTSITRLFVILLLTASSFASLANAPSDRIVRQARQEVAAASADDWHTLATAAEKCLIKNVNQEEALVWLDKSIAIKETAYNLILKGDYQAANGLAEVALEYYSRSIRVGKLTNPNYADLATQNKIVALVKQLHQEETHQTIIGLIEQGDACATVNPAQALAYYSQSIRVGKKADDDYTNADTQEKIVALVKVLGNQLY